MNTEAALVAAPAGAVVGIAVGWLCIALERLEKLAQEDAEDRAAYQSELATARLAATEGGGQPPDEEEEWPRQRFGWSWLERFAAPTLAALGFAAFAAHEPLGWGLLIHLLWVTVFVQIVVFDLKHRLILNRVTYPAIVVALALAEVSPGLTIWRALVGGLAIGLFFFFMNVVSRGGIGLGDAKLGALVGAVCGLGATLDQLGAVYAVIYAIFLGGGTALVLLVTRIRGLKDPIPYGPFLCVGAALVMFLRAT